MSEGRGGFNGEKVSPLIRRDVINSWSRPNFLGRKYRPRVAISQLLRPTRARLAARGGYHE